MFNVELKVKCDNHERIRRLIEEKDGKHFGTDHQIDTYFRVPKGRLKMRQGNIENALIYYQRQNSKVPSTSEFMLYQGQDLAELKEMLAASLGVLVIVDKIREIYFIGNVKIHLDDVKGLGLFVEIEARDLRGSFTEEQLRKQCQEFMDFFGFSNDDIVGLSNSDMLLSSLKSS